LKGAVAASGDGLPLDARGSLRSAQRVRTRPNQCHARCFAALRSKPNQLDWFLTFNRSLQTVSADAVVAFELQH
jgi:hypothetical protein